MRRALLATALVLIAPAPASAAGGGLFPTFGGEGSTAAKAPFTYVTLPAGRRSMVEAVHKVGGAVELWRRLPGSYGTPLVALDGSTTGLSADGRTLVLVRNSRFYPPPDTRLLVLDAINLKVRDHITLPGFSSVDAVSPDGRWVYLVHYRNVIRDANDYEVRAYDLKTHRLDPRPVVDPAEPDEKMGGQPMARTMGAG